MHYYIITGTSRGLGDAIARYVLAEDSRLYCISRKKNHGLIEEAYAQDVDIAYFLQDLNEHLSLEITMQDIFEQVNWDNAESITLINNAAIIDPIKPAEDVNRQEMLLHHSVNLQAPMILSGMFIKRTQEMSIEKRIINISSGAANKPFHGWSQYCSIKAALDMYTRCIAFEQEDKEYPIKAYSFNPGIMDTGMQETIRSSKEEDFKDIDRFIRFKEENLLASPKTVAKHLFERLAEDLPSGTIFSIRD